MNERHETKVSFRPGWIGTFVILVALVGAGFWHFHTTGELPTVTFRGLGQGYHPPDKIARENLESPLLLEIRLYLLRQATALPTGERSRKLAAVDSLRLTSVSAKSEHRYETSTEFWMAKEDRPLEITAHYKTSLDQGMLRFQSGLSRAGTWEMPYLIRGQ